jgi:predicted aconitase
MGGLIVQLNKEELDMLNGRCGYPVQKAMEILVALGEAYGAERMVPVTGVHMPSTTVLIAGDAGVEFLEELLDKGARFVVRTTTNPSAIDPCIWQSLRMPEEMVRKQLGFSEVFRQLGALTCHTCSPYHIGFTPRLGEHVASGESSNVVYFNSVLGARTNREGAPAAIAAALTGRVPGYGLHLTENRKGRVLVRVRTELHDSTDYGALGYLVGKAYTRTVPVFEGVPPFATSENLKYLGAALNSSGAIPLYHVVGVTPEAPTVEAAFQHGKPEQVLDVTETDIEGARAYLGRAEGDKVDWVVLGCPHASIWELRELAQLISGKRVSPNVEFWVCVAQPTKAYAQRMGYAQEIEKAGVKIVCETCPTVTCGRDIACKLGDKVTMATNSAKMAHYSPAECSVPAFYGTTQQCVEAAISGTWRCAR